jgi:hypothetical protein
MFPVLMFTAALAASGMQQKEMPSGHMDMQMMMKDCPMTLPGTNLETAETAAGIAVNITTKPENVVELRRRVEHMATMHSGMSSHEGMMKNQMVPGTATYEPIENGARLTLMPKDPEKLAEFRNQVRAHVEQMKKGGCSMMQGMMGNMSAPKVEPKAEPKTDETDHSAHHPEGKP